MWHDIAQNTDEWLALRAGKIGGSAIAKVMANYGKAFGDPAKALAVTIAIEQITGTPILSNYTNSHMDRGHEEEPIARMIYSDEFFCDVGNGGFFDNGLCGCSPDGLVGDDGIIEIKSAIPSVHYDRIKRKSYDPTYKWQLAFNLQQSGREWIDFVSFCSSFPEGKRLYVYRIKKVEFSEEFDQIDARIYQFNDLLQSVKREIGAA